MKTQLSAPLARHLVGANAKCGSHVERVFDAPARDLHSNIAHGNVPRFNAVPLVPLFALGQDCEHKLAQMTQELFHGKHTRRQWLLKLVKVTSYQQECAATGKGIIMYNWAPLHCLESYQRQPLPITSRTTPFSAAGPNPAERGRTWQADVARGWMYAIWRMRRVQNDARTKHTGRS